MNCRWCHCLQPDPSSLYVGALSMLPQAARPKWSAVVNASLGSPGRAKEPTIKAGLVHPRHQMRRPATTTTTTTTTSTTTTTTTTTTTLADMMEIDTAERDPDLESAAPKGRKRLMGQVEFEAMLD